MGKLNATDFLASTVVNFSHDFSDSKTNSELWKHSEFEVYFRGFCIINVISFFVIVSFLSKQAGNLKNFTSYRIYCIALACSDLLLSVDGFVAVSELDFAFHQEWALQLEAAIMMFAGLFSLNNHVVIACERLQATMISRPNRARIRLQARVNGNALLVVLGSLVMSLVWTLLASFCQGPGFALDSSGQSWGLNWRTDTVKSLVYIWMLMVFEFGIPIVIVVYVYVKIWLVIRNGKFPHQMTPRRRRIVIMCMISTASFLLAWVPYAVLGMFMIFGIPFGKVFSLTANTIAKTSCIYNTLILRHASDTSAPTTTPVNSRRRANGNNCPNNNPSNESWVRRMINRIRSCPSSAVQDLLIDGPFMC
ncbi:rhodopsin, G0-coupled-like isoform X2 [Symsagittifera roscoffensis]|uniref:rhodopsin, G0-coupled-like isoform X2 n=1 Tax=Symsagittifera roscoffensis TaxID=84072 RepID=UPI00307BB2A4